MNNPNTAAKRMTREQEDFYDGMTSMNVTLKEAKLKAERHGLTEVARGLNDVISDNEYAMECYFEATGANEI